MEAKECQSICVVSPEGGGKVIKKNGQDGIIIGEYTVEAWTKKSQSYYQIRKL